MLIQMIPTPGAHVVQLRVEADTLTVNGTPHEITTIPSAGAIRLQDDMILVEYGEEGGVSVGCFTSEHQVEVVPSSFTKWHPEPDPEDVARNNLLAQRASWVAARWQMIAVLGEDRWQVIQDFAAGPYSTWGIKAAIEAAVDIPRISETVDLLAYILDLSEEETDEIFQRAISLRA